MRTLQPTTSSSVPARWAWRLPTPSSTTPMSHVTIVDRRHSPSGHWVDAYPFVRLHQASVFYGVASTVLGTGAIQQHGPEAGLQERAGLSGIRAYYDNVLQRRFHRVGEGDVPFQLRLPRRRPGARGDLTSIGRASAGERTTSRRRRRVPGPDDSCHNAGTIRCRRRRARGGGQRARHNGRSGEQLRDRRFRQDRDRRNRLVVGQWCCCGTNRVGSSA